MRAALLGSGCQRRLLSNNVSSFFFGLVAVDDAHVLDGLVDAHGLDAWSCRRGACCLANVLNNGPERGPGHPMVI